MKKSSAFEDCLCHFWNNGKCGFRKMTEYGDYKAIPCIYESYLILSTDTVALKYKGNWGVLNSKNQMMHGFVYERIEKPTCNSNLCAAMKNGKWGLINAYSTGYATGFIYDHIKYYEIKEIGKKSTKHSVNGGYTVIWGLFSEGRVFVYSDNSEMISPRGFDDLRGGIFCDRPCAIIQQGDKLALLHLDGELITKFEYDEIQSLIPHVNRWYNSSFRFARVKKESKYGVLDEMGKLLLDCEFDDIKCLADSLLLKHDGKWGVLPLFEIMKLEKK